MKKAQRRQLEIARIREDILLAAARAMGRAGGRAATMRDIAREAGFTAASLYTYFRSKEEILRGFVDLMSEEFRRTFEEPGPAGLSFAQRLELLLRRQLELVENRREMMQVLFHAGPPAFAADSGTPCDPFEDQVRAFTAWIRRNARSSDLGGSRAEHAARLLVGAAIAFLHGWVHTGSRRRLADHAHVIVNFFFHGVSGAGGAQARTR